jgi:hypothetical protein
MTEQCDRWWRQHKSELTEKKAERAEAAERINPATAVVWWDYRPTLDPYLDGWPLPPELQQVGRAWFAADPDECVPVFWFDLPKATQDALEA